MDFSEFRRRLGAEPRSTDPDMVRARESGPEFAAAAAEAEEFEAKLEAALMVPEPAGFVDELRGPPAGRGTERRWSWSSIALAAGLLLALGVASLGRVMGPRWDSVEDYVADHYYHDGVEMLTIAPTRQDPAQLAAMFARFDVEAAPELQQIVGVIKICVTPDGQGVHMVLNTPSGPVTVFYMPRTSVEDRDEFAFDGQRAMLVQMAHGSAAIIQAEPQDPGDWYAFVQDSIRPPSGNS